LFGGNESRRSEDRVHSGQSAELARKRGQPEIRQLATAIPKTKHVFWLHVAVDHVDVVSGCEDLQNLRCRVDHFGRGEDPSGLFRQRRQRLSLHQLENQDGHPVVRHEIVENFDDSRMIDEVCQSSLAQETLAGTAVRREMRM
jgi:hypothetical protein